MKNEPGWERRLCAQWLSERTAEIKAESRRVTRAPAGMTSDYGRAIRIMAARFARCAEVMGAPLTDEEWDAAGQTGGGG